MTTDRHKRVTVFAIGMIALAVTMFACDIEIEQRSTITVLPVQPGWEVVRLLRSTDPLADVIAAINENKDLINTYEEDGMSWLCVAASSRLDVVNYLIEHGADVDGHRELILNGRAGSPLYYATSSGNKGIVQTLLDRGADPSLGTVNYRPIRIAKGLELEDIAKLIQDAIDVRKNKATPTKPVE